MKTPVKTIATVLSFLIATVTAQANSAQTTTAVDMPSAVAPSQTATVASTVNLAKDLTDGEIRKVDADNQKITIKHGFIKNLDMPGMTMVFTAKDKALLDGLAAGDKVQFAVEMVNGKFTVTDIKKSAP